MVLPELKSGSFLGKGSHGEVIKFKYLGLDIAVKTSGASSLKKEFQIVSQFKGCSRIIQTYEDKVRETLDDMGSKKYMMLMEFAAGGTLKEYMEQYTGNDKMPDQSIRMFTRMLLEGLATIHGHGYVHCDLKPENILLFPRWVNENGSWNIFFDLKISDFGLSRKEGDNKWWHPKHPFAGTPIYMSPESVSHGETSKGLDLWSLGCIVLSMYTGTEPWWERKDYDLNDLKKCLEKCYAPSIPNDIPCDAQHFIMTCFSLETKERRDALTLLRHSFLHGDVKKITEPPMDIVKTENLRENALKLESVEEKPSEVTSLSEKVGELKIVEEKPGPSLVPLEYDEFEELAQQIYEFVFRDQS